VLALAGVAFAAGAIVGAHAGGSPGEALAAHFVSAWTHGQYAAMYQDIDDASRRSTSAAALANEYREALATATATGARVIGHPHAEAGHVTVPVRVSTRLFGELELPFTVPIVESSGQTRVAFSRSLLFPGLHQGEQLTRRTTLPQRAPLLARDGSVLAEGPAGSAIAGDAGETTRSSPLGEAANAVLGSVGPVPAARRGELEAQGVSGDALVGLSGLERTFDDRLRGRPGGVLLAGDRVLAATSARAAAPVRTSVSPALQKAAVAALGGQLGGIIVLAPATGQVLAVAGLGVDGLQPPGSTFKMVTLTGVLSAGVANPKTVFPYATYATLDGVKLHNANGEECGGSLELAFAVSCNSVFTPLGVKLGAPRLVATAEGFGFNHEPGIPGAAESTLPPASQITGELDVGSTAIGQGQVLATPLQMATVASTIADGGMRPRLTFSTGDAPAFATRATSPAVARTVRRLMIGVVRSGTGTAAAIPGVTVAGKTGTAELKTPCSAQGAASESGSQEAGKEGCQESEASNTDAWFAAFAPALHPRIAVCVLLVKDGAGGATAAPVAREVLEAGLRSGL
jgi:cell division protein FtsI/penicillin-binding protein 2